MGAWASWKHGEGESWKAKDFVGLDVRAYGDTPEEAVANLWLAINKKEKVRMGELKGITDIDEDLSGYVI